MLTFAALANFALIHFLFVISPGPNFLIVTGVSLAQSRKEGLMVAFGVVSASFTWATLTACGLGVVFTYFPLLYKAMYYGSAAYLVWLSLKMLKAAYKNQPMLQSSGGTGKMSLSQSYRLGFLTNITNPKSMVFYTSLFVPILPQDATAYTLTVVIATAVTISALWYIVVALFFTLPHVRGIYEKTGRAVNTVTGGFLLYFGLKLFHSFKPL